MARMHVCARACVIHYALHGVCMLSLHVFWLHLDVLLHELRLLLSHVTMIHVMAHTSSMTLNSYQQCRCWALIWFYLPNANISRAPDEAGQSQQRQRPTRSIDRWLELAYFSFVTWCWAMPKMFFIAFMLYKRGGCPECCLCFALTSRALSGCLAIWVYNYPLLFCLDFCRKLGCG